LQLAASIDLPDFFTFIVGEAMAELDQAPEGGARFPVDARLDGRTFVKFHVDLGVGDEVLEPLESMRAKNGSVSPAVLRLWCRCCPSSSIGRRSFTRTRVHARRRTAACGISWTSC